MHYDPDIFLEQFSIVKRFIYHLFYYRALHASYEKHKMQSEFWVHTIDAHLLQATISWCMVFGSDGCNPTHWKNLSQINPQDIQENFRAGLPSHTGLDMEMWKKYWKELNDFRNEFAAHRHINFQKPVPNFEVALKIAYYYDDWIRDLIEKGYDKEEQSIPPAIFEEPSLKESEMVLKEEVAPLMDQLFEQTRQYQKSKASYLHL